MPIVGGLDIIQSSSMGRIWPTSWHGGGRPGRDASGVRGCTEWRHVAEKHPRAE